MREQQQRLDAVSRQLTRFKFAQCALPFRTSPRCILFWRSQNCPNSCEPIRLQAHLSGHVGFDRGETGNRGERRTHDVFMLCVVTQRYRPFGLTATEQPLTSTTDFSHRYLFVTR
jgi:hypothetical protein